jgi:prepilin-type N-terminal cleavage/methylation domain-containing protein
MSAVLCGVALAKESALAQEEDRISAFRIPHSKGFTLMEMLVVMVVILVLMGLLFPALMGARERAKVTRARSEIQTLQEAWLAYGTLYGGFPSGYTMMSAGAVNVLGGNNPQGIVFMEFDERHRKDGFLDPWWNGRQATIPDHLYKINLGSTLPAADVEWRFTTRVHCANTARYRY